MHEFTKDFFQTAWGNGGYTEEITYGVGMDKICELCLYPFVDKTKSVLEIGSGGGAFTEKIAGKVKHLTAIDVIKKPPRFNRFNNFRYIELKEKNYLCAGVKDKSIDFCFCYGVFCHFPDEVIRVYLRSVHRVLKKGCSFIFMLSSFEKCKHYFSETAKDFTRGRVLPIGHFYQDDETLKIIADFKEWELINPNMIPEHRDIIIHLKKL